MVRFLLSACAVISLTAGQRWLDAPPRAYDAGLALAAEAAATPLQNQTDISPPMGPLRLPESALRSFWRSRWSRRIVAGVLAVGFALVGFHYVSRRRHRVALKKLTVSVPAVGQLAQEADRLSDAELYARLLRVLREALTTETPRPAAAMTPRELADVELLAMVETAESAEAGLHDRWRGLCQRAERAEYGRARIRMRQRREDLQLVVDVIEQAARRRAAREASDEL